jgi:hypothetical protein
LGTPLSTPEAIFNLKTATVSPQYHIFFDDDFTIVPYMEQGEVPPNWEELSCLSTKSAADESVHSALEWMSGQEINVDKDGCLVPIQDWIPNPFSIVPDQHGTVVNNLHAEINNDIGATLSTASEGECKCPPLDEPFGEAAAVWPLPLMPLTERVGIRVNLMDDFETEAANLDSSKQSSDELRMPQRTNLHELGRRRSKRIAENKSKGQHKAHVTFGSRAKQMLGLFALICTVDNYSMPKHQALLTLSFSNSLVCHFEEANEHCNGTLNKFHFISLLTNAGLNEVFTYHQAFKQDDWCDFVTAMEKEVLDHKSCGRWDLVHRFTILAGNKVIKAIWSIKRKCFPDDCLNKHKARLCAHGGIQRWGGNYWETFLPVVNMISVKLLLVISRIHCLESKSIDFVLDFPQADLDEDIWMDLPIDFEPIKDPDHKPQYVLKLQKNLYGLKQASFNWYKKLCAGLKDQGFKASTVNQCLYMHEGMMILVYVDDCIIIGKDMDDIDQFVLSMQNGPENFVLTDEGSIDKFLLGIKIKRLGPTEFEISQPFLIERIVSFLGIKPQEYEVHCNDKFTPAAAQILNKDLH